MSSLTVQNIQGSASSSNTINVASGHKISGAAGSIVAPGHVLQVVSTSAETETAFTSSSFFATSTSVSITPTSTSSKILVTAAMPLQCATSGIIHFTLYRGSTNLAAGSFGRYYDNVNRDNQGNMTFLDSPSTTSATTYAVYLKATGGGTHYYNINNAKSTIVAQEIAA